MPLLDWLRGLVPGATVAPVPSATLAEPKRTATQAALLAELRQYQLDANVSAGQHVVREGETFQLDEAYRWLFGSTRLKPLLFNSFADHPRVRTYEQYDGQFIKNGKLDYTTAAGAYQATATTWDEFIRGVGPMDFSPPSQDLFAVWCFRRHGAVRDLIAGDLVIALDKIRQEWASMPGSTYGQPRISLNRAGVVFTQFGGVIRGG